jgi:hypothetical protein
MKTTLRTIAMTIGLTAVVGTFTLFAQNESKANIPFDFQITGQTLPAGQYLVKLNQENRTLVFRSMETGRYTVAPAYPYKSGAMEQPKLTFLHKGDRYTLETAWFDGIQGGYSPPQGKSDRADRERLVATVRLLQK